MRPLNFRPVAVSNAVLSTCPAEARCDLTAVERAGPGA